MGSRAPEVSVVMPVYNGERFVAEAIRSVKSQTYSDWELVIVDDGSTDATPRILAEFTDRRIRVIRQENGGEARARNAALDVCSGVYTAFLDADDLYLPNALGDMTTYLQTHDDVDVLFSDGYFCDEVGGLLGRLSDVRPGPFTGWILEPLVLNPAVITVPVCTMARSSSIRESGVRFDPALVIGPDWDFWIHLSRTTRFGYLDTLTCMYRIHNQNITKTAGAQRRNADLVRGRLKVMRADWFSGLSTGTHRAFYYNLLVDLLGDDPVQQEAIMHASPFLELPVAIQAELLRQVASDHLSRRKDAEFAIQCLRQSVGLRPCSYKSRLVLWLSSQSPSVTATVLSAWRVAHSARKRIRSFGRRQPKPVPAGLLPASD